MKSRLLVAAVALCLTACSPKIQTEGWKEGKSQGYELKCPAEARIFQANESGEILFQISMNGMNTLIATHDGAGDMAGLAEKFVSGLTDEFDNVRVNQNEATKLGGRKGQGISYTVDYKNGGGNAAASDWKGYSFLFQEDGKSLEYRFMGKGEDYETNLKQSQDIFSTFQKLD